MKIPPLTAWFLPILFVVAIQASEELPEPLRKIELVGPNYGGNPVSLTVTTNEKGQISAIQVSAFGETSQLGAKELAKFSDFRFSEARLSAEGGYEETGGFTIDFSLSHKGFFGGDPFEGDPVLEETLCITLQAEREPELSISRRKTQWD